MSDIELAARADANYFHSWRIIDGNTDGGEVIEREGLLLVSSALPVAWFNLALVTRPLADPDAAVAGAAEFFDSRNLPFLVRIREGVDVAAERACEAHGLPFSDVVPGLVQAPIGQAPAALPRLEIRAAAGEADLRHHRDVLSASFGFPIEIANRLLRAQLLDVASCECYVGYIDGRPVASSALMTSDGVAGVYNVGCVPDARKRGLGEAMTWHAISRGGELGCDIASLQASEMGRPIYERMGFRLVAPYRTFARPSQPQ
jgi:GNAT superfamily N-acetyltransferase